MKFEYLLPLFYHNLIMLYNLIVNMAVLTSKSQNSWKFNNWFLQAFTGWLQHTTVSLFHKIQISFCHSLILNTFWHSTDLEIMTQVLILVSYIIYDIAPYSLL